MTGVTRKVVERFRRAWNSLGARDRKAVTLGAWVLVPSLLFVFGIRPYARSVEDARNRLEAARALLAREHGLLASARRHDTLLALGERILLAEAPRLFGGGDGDDPLMQSALLAGYVAALAADARVFLQGNEARPAVTLESGVTRLEVEVRGVGDLEGILALLHGLEGAGKLAVVERITITPAALINSGPSRDEEVLGFAATIVGFALTSVPGATTGSESGL